MLLGCFQACEIFSDTIILFVRVSGNFLRLVGFVKPIFGASILA